MRYDECVRYDEWTKKLLEINHFQRDNLKLCLGLTNNEIYQLIQKKKRKDKINNIIN